MTTLQLAKLYASMTLVFFCVDLVWLGVVASGFYQRHLGHLLAPKVSWVPALVFYLLFVAGTLVFAVLPGLAAGSLGKTVALAAFLGLIAYATFDLTCLALFRGFPVVVVLVDLVWGATLSATVAAAGFSIATRMGWASPA